MRGEALLRTGRSAAARAASLARAEALKAVEATAVLDRRRDERPDSVNEDTLIDRTLHRQRIDAAVPDAAVLKEIERLGLGRKKGFQDQKRITQRRETAASRLTRQAVLLGKAAVGMRSDWARFNREQLPEVALLGHSNCGKSALLNALSAAPVRTGLAAVSARAGWTAELGFYRLQPSAAGRSGRAGGGEAGSGGPSRGGGPREQGSVGPSTDVLTRRGGGMVLVDTPGYGFAVGDEAQLRQWRALLEEYVLEAPQLALTVLLIDSTRGLCRADRKVLDLLGRARLPVLPVLTKVDLVSQPHRSRCSPLAAGRERGSGLVRWRAHATGNWRARGGHAVGTRLTPRARACTADSRGSCVLQRGRECPARSPRPRRRPSANGLLPLLLGRAGAPHGNRAAGCGRPRGRPGWVAWNECPAGVGRTSSAPQHPPFDPPPRPQDFWQRRLLQELAVSPPRAAAEALAEASATERGEIERERWGGDGRRRAMPDAQHDAMEADAPRRVRRRRVRRRSEIL